MRIAKSMVPLALALSLAACGPFQSLNPLSTAAESIFNPALVGRWSGEGENKMRLKISQRSEKAYKLSARDDDDDEAVTYRATLVQLGDYLFLDVVLENPFASEGAYKFRLLPSDRVDGQAGAIEPRLLKIEELLYGQIVPAGSGEEADHDAYELRLTAAHWFFKASIDGDVLRLSSIEDSWISELGDDEKSELGYVDIGDGVVTAPTQELQAFLLSHAEDEAAFSNVLEWHRQE